jgi:3-hydroxyisobutyrate dehydrogenase
MDELKAKGASVVSSPADAASQADAVVTMLPSTPHVREVYESSVFAAAKPNALLLDCSTIDPNASRALQKSAESRKLRFLDAPVSGGVGGAEAGTLTFMVGGTAADFEAAKPILQSMGRSIVHCGGTGTGQIAKLCNNLILGVSMNGVSEAMNLGVKLGADPKTLAAIINTSTGRCWSSDTYNPVPGVLPNVPSSRGYTGGFGSALMAKDLGLAMDAAKTVNAPLALGAAAFNVYATMMANGQGGKDFSAVYAWLNGSLSNSNGGGAGEKK